MCIYKKFYLNLYVSMTDHCKFLHPNNIFIFKNEKINGHDLIVQGDSKTGIMNEKKKSRRELSFNRKLSGLKYLKINMYHQAPMIIDLWKWIRERQS